MNKWYLTSCLFVIVLLLSCTQTEEKKLRSLLSFEQTTITRADISPIKFSFGWYNPRGNTAIDTLLKYEGQKTLSLASLPEDAEQKAELFFLIGDPKLKGDSVTFSGKYRYTEADSASIEVGIRSLFNETGKSIKRDCRQASDWETFHITTILEEDPLCFYARTNGKVELRLADCHAAIDGCPLERIFVRQSEPIDTTFNRGSGIAIPPLSAQTVENLEVLGKIWGFMKYYHPAVTAGKYNWDYELFRILPTIATAQNKPERNKLLNKWIDSYGKITYTKPYLLTDSRSYSRIIDLDWITDTNLFDKSLIRKLQTIRHADRENKRNYYFRSHLTMGQFYPDPEKPYTQISWSDQGYRLLSLFRLWNAMEYTFPYLDMTDRPWSSLLKEFIPRFIQADSKADYHLSIMELGACINDSHGYLDIPYPDLWQTPLERTVSRNQIPVELTVSKEGEIVVTQSYVDELKRGDILCQVEGKEVSAIIDELAPYTPASNRSVLMNRLLPSLVKTKSASPEIVCIRNGKQLQLTLRNVGTRRQEQSNNTTQQQTVEHYNLNTQRIAYISSGSMPDSTIVRIMRDNWEAKGLIIDLRSYPRGSSYFILTPLLTAVRDTFCWFSKNDQSAPGNFSRSSAGVVKPAKPGDFFKGKVAILVNEGTQSHGEECAMAYRKAPRSAIIGSTTAGADGNIGRICLPGNIQFTYTALGDYYPNWGICQRKGIHIDLEARPTTSEIRNGQDVLIEKAIKYINE